MKLRQFIFSATVLIGWSLTFSALALSDKPLKIIVTGPPGGTSDITARVVGQEMSVNIGRPVIIENRPGATGAIGLNAMLRSDPDGNTIVLGANNMLVEAPQVMKVPYDPLSDIITIARVAFTSYVLVTSTNYPAKDFQDLIAHLKERKGKSSFASYGIGTVSQYSGLILSNQTELNMQHVVYSGSPPALQGVISGQIDMMFDGMVTSLSLIKSGMLRPYAVAGRNRSRYLPDVPTMVELGYPDIKFQGQICFYGSSKLSTDILENFNLLSKKQ